MDDFAAARVKMVESQLRTEDVVDYDVLAAMSEVPREHFVPGRAKPLAYIDSDLMIKDAVGDAPARYLMAPAPLARLLQAAEVNKSDIVLDVGCATGYSAAVLAHLADSVVALESDEELAATASETLVLLGIDNAAVVTGPLESGYPSEGPYDVIFIGGSVDIVPKPLLDQVKQGGRLVAVVGYGRSAPAMVYTRSDSEVAGSAAFDAGIRPLPGFRKPETFVF
jgi:protein-L-isoaspartate(D-aspartate) O-methyltransferase